MGLIIPARPFESGTRNHFGGKMTLESALIVAGMFLLGYTIGKYW
jgi:hypothetical protein